MLESFTGCFTLPQIFVHGEFVGGEPELTRWLDEESSRCIPGSALALGLGGLIPFIAGVVPWLWYRAEPVWFISYAAAVLAFMGGVQWGAGILRPKGRDVWIFTLSIIPALAASVMLVMYSWYAILTLLGGFVFVYAVDLWWVGVGCFPIWYSQLRTVLTPIVVLCLIGWLLH